ncbi:MAG TPA: DUF3276 family protein [Saprospiraceae bacterium]|nr:DUF3276 family protein [Saprospiraceae bacterium]
MDNEKNNQRVDNVFSSKVKAGKRRTYFFDIRQTKGEDYFLTLTESTKRFNGDGYERHKIFLYKEDINRFITGLEEAVKHLKENLMPEYDFDEYTRRQEEWEARRAEELLLEEQNPDKSGSDGVPVEKPKSEEDMTW